MNLFELFVKIGADTSQAEKGMKNTQGISETLSNKIKVMSAQFEAAQKNVDKLTKEFNESVQKTGATSKETQELAKKLDDAEKEAEQAKKALDKYNGELEETPQKSEEAKKGIGNLSAWTIAKGQLMADAMKAVGKAILNFGKQSISAGMEFDSSMSQVAATMGKTVDEIQDLRDFAQEMGSKTAFSASQAADALNYMALAGYNSQQSMEMLPNVLNLAAAGGMELATASDMITDSQTALGLTFEQTNTLVDQMAKTASTTNTSVSQLGEAILSVGGTAKNLAGGTDELNAVLGIFADNGIKGSEAGIHLRNVMLAMNPQTDAAAAAFEQLGLEAYDNQGKLRALDEIFGDLSKSLDGMTDQEKTEALSAIFNKTDLTTVNALLATTEERWDQVYSAIGNAKGAAQKMADTQLDNLAGDITLFKSALEGAQIIISDQLNPTLRGFVQFGSKALSELSEGFKEGGLSGAMDALGSLLGEGLTMVTQALPDIVKAGVSLLEALIKGISENSDKIAQSAVDVIVTLSEGILGLLPEIIKLGLDLIVSLANGISQNLGTLIPTIIDVVLQIVDTLTNPETLSNLLDAALVLLTELAYGLMDAIPALVDATLTIIENLVAFLTDPVNIGKLLLAAVEIIIALATGIVNAIPRLLEYWKKVPKSIIDNIKNTDWKQLGKNIVDGLLNGLKRAWTSLTRWFSNAWDNLVGGVKDLLGIHSPSRVFAGIGKNMALGVGEGWEDEFGDIQNNIDKSLAFDDPSMSINASVRKIGAGSAGMAYGGTSFGDIIINIDGAKYSDEQSLASAIAQEIQNMTDRRAAVYA